MQFTDVKTGEISPILPDIDQFLLDDLPITWLDCPARDDLGANTKGVLNSVRELNETQTDLVLDFHQDIHFTVFALIRARIGTENGESSQAVETREFWFCLRIIFKISASLFIGPSRSPALHPYG